jgi:hypothetical protein
VTKQLFVLAAWAAVATGMMGLAGSWHTKSYTVAQPAATTVRISAVSSQAVLPLTAAPCVKLDHQLYCRAWSAKSSSMSKTEFLRSGETVDRWQNMITILRFDNSTLKGAIQTYMSIVRAYMGPQDRPVWIAPTQGAHRAAAATRLVLQSPDKSDGEYVVVYFFSDPGKPVYAIAFSQHLPLPSDEIPTMAQYGKWLTDLQAMPAASVAR